MNEFKVGDTVIIDRAKELFTRGRSSRFSRKLLRAWGEVTAVLAPDSRPVLQWYSIPDGKSLGTLGRLAEPAYLIHSHKVEATEYLPETAGSIGRRLAAMRSGGDVAITSDPLPVGGRVQVVYPQWPHDRAGLLGRVVECPAHEHGLDVRSVMLDGIQGDSDAEPGEPGEPSSGWTYGIGDLRRVGDGRKGEHMNTDELVKTGGAGRGAALAHGDRQKAYGHPKVSFDRIAEFWTTYLEGVAKRDGGKYQDIPVITGEDVAHMMNLLKISRSITDKGDDTIDDIEGYVTCVRMIREAEAESA